MTFIKLLIVIVCCLAFQQLLNAQTTYTSVQSGEWNDSTVWSPVGVPGAGDIVYIDQQTIVLTNGHREIAGFSILVGGELALTGVDGSLTITGNASWGVAIGGGIIRGDGSTNNNGVVTIASGAVMEIVGNQYPAALYGGARLLNQGTVRMVSGFGIYGQDGSVIENQALFEIDPAGNFGGFPNGGTFINTGTFRHMGSGTCSINGNWNFQNLAGGIIDAANGVIDITNFENAQDAIIKGVASVNVHNTFTNDGINAPGNSAGMLTFIGNYIPSSTGVLEIELGGLNAGSEYDQLAVTGNANLNGALNISLFGGFIPAAGDSFVVLTTTGSINDSFMTVNAQSGLYLSIKYKANNVTIVVDSVGVISSIEDELSELTATNYELSQNYPNPFNPNTRIRFSIPEASFTTLKVYSILGQEVATLVNGNKSSGVYEVNFVGINLSSGTYIYKLQAGNFVKTKKMLLLK